MRVIVEMGFEGRVGGLKERPPPASSRPRGIATTRQVRGRWDWNEMLAYKNVYERCSGGR